MNKYPDGHDVPDAISAGLADGLDDPLSSGPYDLVVLRALGRRRRMAKTIRHGADRSFIVEPHDGRAVFHVAHARTLNVASIVKAGRGLTTIAGDEFVIRGAIQADANTQRMRRLLHPKENNPATLAEVARAYVIFDVDGASAPIDFDPFHQVIEDRGPPDDPASFVPWESAIDEFVRQALPHPFHGISCWWQFTASMGFKPGLHMRLLFVLDRPMTKDALTRWLGPNLRQSGIDTSVFGAAQQILVAPPILKDGAPDPIRLRASWLTGAAHIVIVPPASDIAAMPHPRRQSARSLSKPVSNAEVDGRQSGLSFAQRLALIGDGPGLDGFHNATLAAIGTWIRTHDQDADITPLQVALADAITQAPRDSSVHSDAYVRGQQEALPRLIADVQHMQHGRDTEHACEANHVIAPPCPLPTRTLAIAAHNVHAAIKQFFEQLPALLNVRDRFWRDAQMCFGQGYPAHGIWHKRAAVLVGTGIGKSHAAIIEICMHMLSQGHQVGYVVPEHKLADDVCRRFNAITGQPVAQVWRGVTQPDPADPAHTMCRRPVEANLVQLAGGDLGSLCGSSKRGSLCPHNPDAGGACAYRRQLRAAPQIWIVPAVMLTKAVPIPLRRDAVTTMIDDRPFAAHPPAFDILVLDEAPFLGFLGGFDGDGVRVPLDWLEPAQWETSYDQAEPTDTHVSSLSQVLRSAQQVILHLHQGGTVAEALQASNLDVQSCETVVARLWRGLERAGRAISPASSAPLLAETLAPSIARAHRLRGVQRFLSILADISTGHAHPTAVERSSVEGMRAVRLRWREPIHPSWIDCPVLYLDATACLSVAERWLGPITLLADVQAAAPHMTVMQVHDRAFGYSAMIAPEGATPSHAARANQQRVADILQVAAAAAGGAGLLVGPKAMITQMQAHRLIPSGWQTANFGALRGVDHFKDVPIAVIVSRQMPAPCEVERMASIIFATDVLHIEDWYPVRAGARLMADGTGRPASFECHPDAQVEAIRWSICEAEVQQAIGRVRGVRRTADNPVQVIVLNGVDLGPIAIDQLISWDDLLTYCGPVNVMVARGMVAKLWADVAALCTPRWDKADNPGHAAKIWFSRHPEEKARLQQIWKTGQVSLPWSPQPTLLRQESLGLSGKNHRRVWLAKHVDLAMARERFA